jgi:flagellar basal body L-ring protein FlgH
MFDGEQAEVKDEDKFAQFRRPASLSTDAMKRKRRLDEERNDHNGPSLWTGRGTDSYLFTNETEKQIGDIILVNVLEKLKKEIATELKLSQQFDKWERKKVGEDDKKKEAKPAAKEDDKKDGAQDHISTVVEEAINKTHMILKGRKTVLFNKKKKLIEFRGLVARKDISEKDTINSDQILESTVEVLR